MHIRIVAIAVSLTALSAPFARGDTITFDFTTVPIGVGPSFTYYAPGNVAMRVSGMNTIGNTTSSALVSRTVAGLGVVGAPIGNPLGMDGLFSVESLMFDFSPLEVVIDRMRFNFIDDSGDHDEVHLTVIGNGAQTAYDISTQGVGSVNFDFTTALPLLNAQQRTGMKFIASTTDWNDHYTIAGITVEYSRLAAVSAVPTPSAVIGGGALLAGLGLLRWAKARSAGAVD